MARQQRQTISAEEMNMAMPPVLDDDTDLMGHTEDYVKATNNLAGPGMGDVLAAAGTGTSAFVQDPAVLEYNSTAIVEAQNIAYTNQRANQMRGFGESMAALQSSGVQMHADPQYKEQLKNILQKASHLPMPDVVVNSDNQRIILGAQVTQVPSTFDTPKKREESLALLEAMIGYDATIEVCSCARGAGIVFVGLPVLWLSQVLAIESKKNANYDDLPKDLAFSEELEGQLTHDIPNSIAKLFSSETARSIQMIAKIHRVPMLYVLRYLVDKVCKQRRAIVKPAEGGGTRYNDLVPQIHVPGNAA